MFPITNLSELVEAAELCGRKITIYLVDDFSETKGILHSISDHGVLLKTINDSYEFYPWHQIKKIIHGTIETYTPPTIGNDQKEKPKVEAKKEIKIVKSPLHLVEDLLEEDYNTDWEDNEETILIVDDTEGETTISIDIDSEEIEVFDEKDMKLAKKIAEKLDIYTIEQKYR